MPNASTEESLVLTRIEGPVAHVSFNEPSARNPMNDASRLAYARALDEIAKNDEIRVVVLRGEGTAFSSGGDLRSRSDKVDLLQADPYAYLMMEVEETRNIVTSIFNLHDKLVLAAFNGPAIGQGFELAFYADYRVAVESARFALTQVEMALSPPYAMGPFRYMMSIGDALRLIFLGEYINADEAQRMGLVDCVVPDNEFDATIDDLAQRLAKVPVQHVFVIKHWFQKVPLKAHIESMDEMYYAQFFLRSFEGHLAARDRLRGRVMSAVD
jgi:2-(1,2-epoxy-1,2-dihydrophenyl)acetyl-CoA isomerase